MRLTVIGIIALKACKRILCTDIENFGLQLVLEASGFM